MIGYSEPKITETCCHLIHQLQIAWYCSKRLSNSSLTEGEKNNNTIENNDELKTKQEQDIANNILPQIRSQSFLFTLSDRLSQIPIEELLKLVESTPNEGLKVLDFFLFFFFFFFLMNIKKNSF
jgi:hypothetical protein